MNTEKTEVAEVVTETPAVVTETPAVVTETPAVVTEQGSAKLVKEKKILQVRFEMLKVDLDGNRTIQPEKVKEYAKTIKESGVDKEMLCRLDKTDGKYLVIDGNHRYLACEHVINAGGDPGWIKIEVDNSITDEKRLILQIRRNVNADLLPIDEATIYSKLLSKGYKQADIARETGKTPAWISTILKVADAPKKLHDLMKEGKIAATTALAIAKAEDYNWDLVLELVEKSVEINSHKVEQGQSKKSKVTEKDLVAAGAKKISRVHKRIDKVIETIKSEEVDDKTAQKSQIDLLKTIQKAADLLETDPEKFRKFVLSKLTLTA